MALMQRQIFKTFDTLDILWKTQSLLKSPLWLGLEENFKFEISKSLENAILELFFGMMQVKFALGTI